MTAEDTFYFAKLSQLAIEEWLPVPGYEGYYEVSNLGRVRSLDRVVPHKRCGKQTCKGKVLSLTPRDAATRPSLVLSKNGKVKKTSVHKLVALSFIGPNPEGLEVCHNNGLASDNRLFNLRYDTRKNNEADKVKHGTLLRGSKHGNAKLTEPDVVEIKRLLKEGSLFQRQIAKRFGVSSRAVRSIKCGRTWTHVQ